jgi:hypothetical protein
MQEQTRKERFKQWCEEHPEAIAIGVRIGIYAGVIGGAIALSVRQQKKTKAKLSDAIARGDHVLMPGDGTFWIVPSNQQEVA